MKNNTNYTPSCLDLVGIGLGPFNLGLAALLDKFDDVSSVFLEKKKSFSWHDNMLLDNAKLQVHYLKDLVTLVDPTSKFSFLSYLNHQNRLYQFVNRKTNTISRIEFNQYLDWVSQNIKVAKFDNHVKSVEYKNRYFVVHTDLAQYISKNIVVGIGTLPYIQPNFKNLLCNNVFHCDDYKSAKSKLNFINKRIIIIGGGQSGAEVFEDIISSTELPTVLTWVSKRTNFNQLDDACFSNEFYIPSYVKYFNNLSNEHRERKLDEQKLTSDGITTELANDIYNKLYELTFVKKVKCTFNLLVNHIVNSIKCSCNEYLVETNNMDTSNSITDGYDIVILATGYSYLPPSFLSEIFPYMKSTKDLLFNSDYSIQWEHGEHNKIFVQNSLKHKFGIADSNLSLSAWRNSIIINSILKRQAYKTNTDCPMINIDTNNSFDRII